MFNLKVLSREETEKLLNMEDVIKVVESTYVQKSNKNADAYEMVYAEFEPGVCDMDIKSGWLKESGNYGMKLTSWFSENHKQGLPEIVAVVMVFDDKTGVPIGLLDGSYITGMRTGAAGAIGAKYLARKDSKNLMMVGAGNIATYQIAAMLKVFPELEKVRIYNPKSYDVAKNKADSMVEILNDKFGITEVSHVEFSAVENPEEALKTTDIVITVTPSQEPLIKKEWIKAGTHISCVGSDMAGKEEIDPRLFENARVLVDDIKQCINVGEIEIPIRNGILKEEDIAGEIGDVISNRIPGRKNDEEITIYDTIGIALLDIATAELAFEKAKNNQVGSTVEL